MVYKSSMEANHMGDAGGIQKVKTTDVNKDILDKFWVLSEGKEVKRLRETKNLLTALKTKQLDHNNLPNKNFPLCGDLQYSLRRLVKGLSSSKKWARVGFATALTQILSEFPEVQIRDVLALIEETLTFTQQESKAEQGNIMFGKVTALIAIIRSRRLDQGCGEETEGVVSSLIQLQGKKSYLQQPCVCGLQILINSVDKVTFTQHILPQLREELSVGWKGCTPDRLLLAIMAASKGFLDRKFLKSCWNGRSIMDKQNWSKIQEVVLNSASIPPIIHPVNELILEQVTTDQSLLEFWSHVLAKLFQPEKRKLNYLGLFYLKSVIPAITTTTQFVEVFSHGVSQCVLQNLFSKHGGLWEITKSVGDSIVTLAATSQDGHLQSAILRHLLCLSIRYAQAQFFLAIIKKLNPEGASMFSCDLMKLLIGEKLRKDVSFTQDSIRKWAALQLRFLVSKPALVVDNNQLLSILQFLCLHSFFTVNSSADQLKHVNGPVPQPLLDPVRICVQDCFFGAINNLNIPVSEKSQRRDLSTYLQVLYKLTRYAQSLLAADAVSTVKELPEQVVEELEMALDTVQKIQAKKTSSTPDSQAFQMLYLHLSLQLLAEPKDALEILKDLHICFEKSQKKVKKSSKNKEGDDLAWIEVLTELLISMMSQESRLTRSVSRIVFRLLSQHVTRNALDLIINVLHTTDDEGEEGPITFEDEDADSDDEDDDKQDDRTVNGNRDKNGNHDNHGDDDVSEDDDDVDMGDDSGEDVDVDHLRQTVKAALGPAAAESDKDEESDEEMGDEEMFRIDDTLSEAFKSMQRGKTKEMKKRKQQLLKFKLRTVDLVETFVKSQPPAGLLVHLVGPMLDLMESGYRHKEESSLGKRAATVLHHILKLRKRHTDPDMDKEEVLEKMDELIQYSTKVSSLHMVKEVSLAFNFLMRVILNCEVEADVRVSPVKTRSRATSKNTTEEKTNKKHDIYLEKALGLLKSALTDYLQKKNARLHYIFFQTTLERHWSTTWPLSDVLLDCVKDESVRVFLRTQACSMLSSLLKPDMQVQVGEEEWIKFTKKFTASLTPILLRLKKEDFKPKHTHEMMVLLLRFLMADKIQGKKLVENVKDNLKSLSSAMNSDCKKVWKKILAQAYPNTKLAQRKKKKGKKRKIHSHEVVGKMEIGSPAKTQKLAHEKITESPPSPSKHKKGTDSSGSGEQTASPQKMGAKPSNNNDENGDLLSDSTVTSSLSEASGDTTPKKKSKLESGGDIIAVSEDSVLSSPSTKRKCKTPRKSMVS